jgi:hypothetical protein
MKFKFNFFFFYFFIHKQNKPKVKLCFFQISANKIINVVLHSIQRDKTVFATAYKENKRNEVLSNTCRRWKIGEREVG